LRNDDENDDETGDQDNENEDEIGDENDEDRFRELRWRWR